MGKTDTEDDRVAFVPLTVDRVRELWSRTYNREGKPDWSHISPTITRISSSRTASNASKASARSPHCVTA